jgi:filamentous hemagglutinin family protein
MSSKLGRLAEVLPLLTARVRASAATGVALSRENRDAIAQLMLLRADIALRIRTAATPPVALLHLDAALAELEAAFHGAADERLLARAVANLVAPVIAHAGAPAHRRPARPGRTRTANLIAFATPFVFTIGMTAYSGALYAGNVITPDGRTQTNINVNGSVTDITTNTVQNGTGYNSFNQFQVDQGNTVNMQVPNQAQRLMNVVTQGPVSIQGTLNGYQNGKIGGDVYFADPYGFVVGSKGAVNVGSLTVRTPTQAVTGQILDQNGNADATTTNNVVSGNIPVSPDGAVSIQGRINAPGGVHITAQSVDTTQASSSSASAPADAQSQEFNQSVNTQGLQQGAKIVASNGNIDITTAGDANIGGQVSADGAANRSAGTVTIAAGGNANLDSTANATAKGNGAASNGGSVKITAAQNLNVGTGATVDVSAGSTGNGGTIELSAKGAANFTSAILNAGATSGAPGSILIDPTDVTIGQSPNTPPYNEDIPTDLASIDTNGGNVTITATNSITLEAGAYINTRWTAQGGNPTANNTASYSVGGSGNVSLTAPTIDIYGAINTFALNQPGSNVINTPGNITLTASASDPEFIGKASATTGIDISGTLDGGNIDVESNATATSVMSVFGIVAQTVTSSIFGANSGWVDGDAHAAITVDGTARITSAGDVTLNSWTEAEAEDPAFNVSLAALTSLTNAFVPAVMVGQITAISSTTVASGASISAAGILTVRAHNDDTLDISDVTVTSQTAIDATVAYSSTDVESTAVVNEGATISAGQVNVVALNTNDKWDTAATAVNLGTGTASIVAAISGGETSKATAHFGPSLTLNAADPNSVAVGDFPNQALLVEANSITAEDAVSASATTGSNLVVRYLTAPVAGALTGTQGLMSNALTAAFSSFTPVKFGAAVALTINDDQSSSATIGGAANDAPTISGSQVVVTANTIDAGARSNANNAVNSPNISDATPANPTAQVAVSAAVSVALRDLSSDAEIGSGADITAPDIGISASTTSPITITWLDGSSFQDVVSHINPNLGVVNDVLTSFADSTADAGDLGISGSFDIYNVDASSNAFVGDGATLNSTGATAGPWTAILDDGNDGGHGVTGSSASTMTFNDPVTVEAYRDVESLNFTGNISVFLTGVNGSAEGATSFGASFVDVNYSGATNAGVGSDATVESNASVGISARSKDKTIGVSPASGTGGKSAVSGMVSMFNLGTSVHASIAASAAVSGSALDLSADQVENVGTLAGSVLFGNANSIGALYTQNDIHTNVKAYIGNNSADDDTQSASLIPVFTAPVAGVTTTGGTVDIGATESGTVQSLAVAVDAGSNNAIGAAVANSNIDDSVTTALDGATVNAKDLYVASNANDTINTIAMGAAAGTATTSIAATGSSADAEISPTILSTIDQGSKVAALDNVGLTATNEDNIQTIAGAAGLSDGPGGVGLSVTVNHISGSTTASITGNNTVVDADNDSAADTFAVNSGVLANAPDVSSVQAPTDATPDLGETQDTVTGLAVVATSHQAAQTVSATLGMSGNGLALAIVPVTTIVSCSATAYIDGASIDKRLDLNAVNNDPSKATYVAPKINVIAGNQTYAGDFIFAIGVAGSKGGAGAGAVATNEFTGHTKAYVLDTTVGSTTTSDPEVGALDIYAGSAQEEAVIVLGGAGGGLGGGAASLAVTLFSADTESYLEGGAVTVASLGVNAGSNNGANILDGAAAIGKVGVGGSIAVTINNDTTLAYVGDKTDTLNSGTIDATTLDVGSADVEATTNNDFTNLVIAAAGGYYAGVAAMANVTTMSNTTDAGFYSAEVNQNTKAAGAITAKAHENDTIDATAGGGAGGAAGIGIAANVIVMHATVTGTLLNSDINSAGAIDVSAEGDRSIDALTVTGAVGYFAGVSAAAGVVLAGTDASSDVQGQINQGGSGTVADADQLAANQGVTGLANAVDGGSPDTITASVSGGSMSAGSLTIDSTGKTSTSNQAIGVAAGAYAGVGGAVAYTDVGSSILATLDNTSPSAPSVSITALNEDNGSHAVSTEADAGGGGLVGIGAGVSIGLMDDTVGANVNGSANGNHSGTFDLSATDTASLSSTAAGGAAGGVAIGVMVATATKNSTVAADTALGSSLSDYSSVDVESADSGSVDSSATGVSGGTAGAANAAAATSSDTSNVYARLGDNTDITGMTGTVLVESTDTPSVDANAYGVAVADGVSLGLSLALTSVSPTVDATLGDNVSISGAGGLSVIATLTPPANSTDASSESFTGTGGTLVGLDGSAATTTNNSDVEAKTGTDDTIPDGDLSVAANNTSNQSASASGVSVGGLAGGASVAEANTGSKTIATLGHGTTDPTHTGAVSVKATGNDTDQSHATAGTYGLVTGNASVSNTDNNADVEATVDSNTHLPASTVTVKATHQDNYSEDADSSQVSVLGESGAYAKHSADTTVTTTLDSGVDFIAADTIDIGAQEDFTDVGTTNSAYAGGGGVANGASGGAKTDITGSSTVNIESGVTLTAGTDPILNPGHIDIVADSNIDAADYVSLSTGGALEGAGLSENFKATTNNSVDMVGNDTFLSFGNFDAGTYTDDNVTAQADAHTWGILGAVANADSSVSLASTQTVELGSGSTVEVYGNANVTAGQNPADGTASNMQGAAQALTYVSGFIAVPAASASSSVTDNTSTTIDAGAVVNAGENATIGSYAGVLAPTDDAEGHGYELGFIPVKDGNASDPSTSETQTVAINGDVTAGAFNDLNINIADCGDVTGGYCGPSGVTVSGNFLADAMMIAPVAAFASNFSPVNFINQRIQGADAALLASTVSNGPVGAITLGTLFASPGDVTVHSDSLSGSGKLTANGSASITVNNASPDYLIVNATEIPNIPGGSVFFSGNVASAAGTGISVTQNNTNNSSSVTFNDSYQGNDFYLGSQVPPSVVFVNGEIANLGGTVTIDDQLGSLGQFAPIEAQNVVINVPQGTLVVDLSPGLLETTGASVQADWAPFIVLPGNEGSQGVTPGPFNADLAVAYAVNSVFNANGQYGSDAALTAAIDNASNSPSMSGLVDSHYTDGKGSDAVAFLVYGTCYPDFHSGANCGAQSNQQYSPINQVWNTDWADLSRSLPLIPTETLSYADYNNVTTPAAASATASSASAITANKISISATYIDVDSDVTAGPPTNWSVDIPTSLSTQIANDQLEYQQGTHSAVFALTGTQTVGADDSLINVSYVAGATAADGQIVVNNVLAAAQEAASIKLDGDIISTNALGHIHVNAGLGQVNIDNQTSTAITVNNVEAGNAGRLGGISGSIEIVDTNRPAGNANDPDHFWYEFTPGQGTTTYVSDDPNATLAQATETGTSAATDFSFHPVQGLEWQWSEMAFLGRSVTIPTSQQANGAHADPTTTNWGFTDPSGNALGLNDNNPWYYVDTIDPSSAATAGSGFFYYNPGNVDLNPNTGALTAATGTVLTTDPARAGKLISNFNLNGAYMVEQISGTLTPTYIQTVDSACVYSGPHCGDQGQGPYNSFTGTQDTAHKVVPILWADNGDFDFDYITKATVTITTTVKADNPIAVSFTGATTGSVTINSAAPVTINGQIENPNGTTTIDTTAGGVSTSPNGSIATQYLNMDAAGAIGTATNPLVTTQTNNGTLNATGAKGVYIAATSALTIGQIDASTGDVVLSAQGDIIRAGTPSPANVIGDNVTLTATHDGSVGSDAAPIQTAATGTVNVTADGNVAIEQTQGDLNAGTIQSTGIGGQLGTVQVAVDNGALLDAANTTQTQALSLKQQQDVWARLKLTVATGGAANANAGTSQTVQAVTNTVNADYQQYWTLLSQGSVQNGSFILNAGSASLFQQVASASGMTPQAYAAHLYSGLAADFAQYVGANWQSQSEFQSRVTNFSFTPSQSLIDGLIKDPTETEAQLLSALSLTAVQPSSTTTIGTTKPNISGSAVTLRASEGLGSLAPPVTITLGDLTSANLTPSQEAAIALAKNPGAILFTGTNAQNQAVEFTASFLPDGSIVLPAGITLTGVSIGQTAPLFVSATDIFNASAPHGGVFAQATSGDLKLGSVDAASGPVNLTAPDSILAANPGISPVITGGLITLLASAGDIGSSTTPLVYTGSGGTELSSATAGADIYLETSGISMNVGRIFAGGDVTLDAPDGAIAPTLAGIALEADNLTLAAQTDIGSPSQAFEVALTGQLNATAGGSINVTGENNLHVGTITSPGDLEVTATGNLIAGTLTSAGGSVDAAAGLNATLTDVSAATSATLTAVGVLSLLDVTTAGDMTLGSGGAMTLGANGDLKSGGALTITRSGSFSMGAGSTASSSGAFALTTAGDATITKVTAGGNATINAGGNVTIDPLSSGGLLNVTAGGALETGSLTSAGKMTLAAGGPITIDPNATLSSGGAATISRGTSLTMGLGSLIAAVNQIAISVSGNAVVAELESLFNGDHAISVTSGGSITGNGGSQTNIVDIALDAKVYLAAKNGIGTDALPIVIDTPFLAPTTQGGGIALTALSGLTMPDVSARGDIEITSVGNLTTGNLSAGGLLVLTSANNLAFGNATAGGNVTLSAGNGISGTSLTTPGSATLTTGPGSLSIGMISAADLTLSSPSALDLADLVVTGNLTISAPEMTIGITQSASATGKLNIVITGPHGGEANSAKLHIAAPNGIVFGKYFVDTSTIVTTAALVDIDQGEVGTQMFLITPDTDLYLNDVSPTPIRDVTEQFWAPGKTFFLDQNATTTKTNAYAIDWGPGVQVITVDPDGRTHPAFALARTAPLPLFTMTWQKIYAEQGLESVSAVLLSEFWQGSEPNLSLFDQWVVDVGGNGAVNTGSNKQASNQ